MEKEAQALAGEAFQAGYNCCESMLKVSIDLLNLEIPRGVIRMGHFFRKGIAESGCVCGALAGGVMVLGFVMGEHLKGKEAVQRFQKGFKEQQGSTCCRVIRKGHNLFDKFTNRECRELTANSALLLFEILLSYGINPKEKNICLTK